MSTAYQTTGTIAYIGDTQQVSEKFSKRTLALTVADGQYSETPSFEAVQDKTSLLDGFAEGQEVTVHWNLKGREYTPKSGGGRAFFSSMQIWKVEAAAGAAQSAPAAATSASRNPSLRAQPAAAPIASDDDNDLPF